MSEANVPSRDSENLGWDSSDSSHAEAAALPNVSPEQSEATWQTVNFPGTLPAEAIAQASQPQTPSSPTQMTREAELLALVRDLNQCNDHLIARVAHLEDALETSQMALQAEVARSQEQQSLVSRSEQIAVNNQQVAQLVSDLDFANQGLRRQQMLNETLQTELENSRQRVAQLERECAIVQQRYGEQSQSLNQAETACRDLRARLQRQQRYTMQFKVALEKCLDVPSSRQSPVVPEAIPAFEAANNPVSMPKAKRIQPWSAVETAPVGNDLASLMAGMTQPSAIAETSGPESVVSGGDVTDPEAENRLWQDLERVIEGSAAPTEDLTAESASEPAAPAMAAPDEVEFTEPSPWGMPIKLERPTGPSPAEAPSSAESDKAPKPESVGEAEQPHSAVLADSGTASLPSPELAGNTASPPSPLVYPLRPQKKRQSLAAVDLPSFAKSKRSSG